MQVSTPPDAAGRRSPRRALAPPALPAAGHPGPEAEAGAPAARRDARPRRIAPGQGFEHPAGGPGLIDGAEPAWKLARRRSGSPPHDISTGRPAAPEPRQASPIQLSCVPGSRMLEPEEKYQFNSVDHGLSRSKIPAR